MPTQRTALLLVTLVISLAGCTQYTSAPLTLLNAHDALVSRGQMPLRLAIAAGDATTREWVPFAAEVQLDDGLTLSEANTLALFYAPEVLTARSEERVAGAQILQAGRLANPELSVGPRLSTEDASLIFPAVLSWEVPVGGDRQAERALATSQHQSSQWRVLATELTVLQDVRRRFIHLAALTQGRAILDDFYRSSVELLNRLSVLQQAGEVDSVTLYLARVEEQDAAVAVEEKVFEITQASQELRQRLGLLPTVAVDLHVEPALFVLPELPDANMEALQQHPALQAAFAAYRSAEEALRLEVARQYPDLAMGPSLEVDDGDLSLGAEINLTLPLLDRNRGGIAVAAERRAAAREVYQRTLLELTHTATAARLELQAAERFLTLHRTGALQAAYETAQAVELRLRTGLSNVVEVLTAQRAIARAQLREVALQEQASLARLRAALAEGVVLHLPDQSQERGGR
ncbi:TolC family protein [Candidatus Entotheonella palauensis]|uniref:TolC family protein n=1 Tax=Candidatus Entotheonella palauensis TaxID=93172 RepID=UPI000B7F9906|nr:TolC family protein [Candidatus Entotheonella palauensis]